MPIVPGDYNKDIPRATDQLSVSQNDLLNNFGAIYALIGINHVNFNAGTDAGKHYKVEFPTQPADPGTTANELAIYAKNSYSNPTLPALYVQKSNGVAVPNGGFTEYVAAGPSSDGAWTRLPSNLLVKWGFTQTTLGAVGISTYSFQIAATIPVFTSIFGVFLTPTISGAGQTQTVKLVNALGTITPTGFQVYQPQAQNCQYFYLAIGV